MTCGLLGSNWSGVNQLRRSEVVAPSWLDELPPLVDRVQNPYWLQANTFSWSTSTRAD